MPYSHQEEAGKPRWLCSHIWLFNWDGSSILDCLGISFYLWGLSSRLVGHLPVMTQNATEWEGGSQYSKSQVHDWCNITSAAFYWSKHIKGPTRIQGEGNLTLP